MEILKRDGIIEAVVAKKAFLAHNNRDKSVYMERTKRVNILHIHIILGNSNRTENEIAKLHGLKYREAVETEAFETKKYNIIGLEVSRYASTES